MGFLQMNDTGNKYLYFYTWHHKDGIEHRGIFLLYSLYDRKWVYEKVMDDKDIHKQHVYDFNFDQVNNMIYMLTDRGILRSKIFWQK